ncbi:ABC transporter permease [Chryseolinea lacunae]|uniref:ABC transporter permease n=1 Tax=Chryseolinea lacunae TaxID=2801331 RepID=A0ABS1L2U4_9BACT|nr:ABC transporter permease [Chryseolinea lacunae]MBL0745868.1 ABC transporter permease [Chryseolinea lacunae]
MLRHNLVIIFRGLVRFKRTFVINLVGLSVGLASALLIFLWVNDELSVDKFHEKNERLFQVMTNVPANGGWNTVVDTPGPLAQTLAEEMPEIEYAAAVAPPNWRGFDGFILTVDKQNIKATGEYAGKDYFQMFSYGLMQGEAKQVLTDKNSIVISDELAMKLFSTTEGLVGKTIAINHEREYMVSGVFAKTTTASSVRFDFVLPFDTYLDVTPWYKEWDNFGPHTYLVLREGTDPVAFNAKLKTFFQARNNGDKNAPQLLATRYSDNYLHGNFENGVQSGGRIAYVNLFSAIGLFILVIASINFMNLSTAKAAVRTKEVGVKKALGAGRKRLAIQFIGESMLMTLVSLVVAIGLVVLALPQFNIITGKELAFTLTPQLVVALTGITLVTGLVAGSYPAMYLSGFNPVAVLKGKLTTSTGELWVRKGLVAFQFTLSIVLIVSVFVVYKQIEFVQNTNLGYEKDNVIYFEIEGRVKENAETFLSEIKRIPGIQNAASTTSDMTGHNWSVGLNWEGKANDDKARAELMAVNSDFLSTVGLEVKEGRFFSNDFVSDTTRVVVNEAAAKAMGFDNAIGKHVKGLGDLEIIGVVKDFHLESFHEEVKPQLFVMHRKHFAPPSLIMARLEAGKEKETLQRLAAFYKTYNPGFPLDYTFLDDEYQALYTSEQRVSALSKYFAGLAILISCLGLFGLAAFTAQRRIKEIGIRKILGSSDFGIVRLLSSDFIRTILVAIVIALPLSYFITHKWLVGFAYRIELEWWFFAGSGCLALLIALFTVALQTVRASRTNPTECLKQE